MRWDFFKGVTLYQLSLIAGLALAYFITGKSSLSFAIPPGFSSPVWPPSGISLAALLIFGRTLWPGIFIGSFLTNTLPLVSFSIIPINLVIAAGASLQALVGFYMLRCLKVTYRNLFDSYPNIFSFIAVAVTSCIINTSLANFCLYVFGKISRESFFESWATWWLGDTTGVCVLAPFLLVWFTPINRSQISQQGLELAALLILSIFSSLLIFGWQFGNIYPLAYILMLFLLWSAFRFNPRITLIILFLSMLISTWGTAHGYGPFAQPHMNTSLILLQIYTLVMTVITLTMIGLINELKRAYIMLKQYSIDLEQKIQERTLQLEDHSKQLQEQAGELKQQNQTLQNTLLQMKHMQRRMVTQEKLASLGTLTAGLAQQMRNPLNFVINFSDICLDLASQLKEWLTSDEFQMNKRAEVLVTLSTLHTNLQKVHQYGINANKIVERMVFQAPGRVANYQSINLNALIDEYLTSTYADFLAQNPEFPIAIEKAYDPAIGRIETIPEDIGRAFINVLANAFDSVKSKKRNLGPSFTPVVLVLTRNIGDDAASIIIRDNGHGISENIRKNLFIPFYTTKIGHGMGLGLPISQDLIVQNLGGEIKVDSIEGEYAEFTIIIPKTARSP